jgi:tetratricopeptide (TPR) repeat protein
MNEARTLYKEAFSHYVEGRLPEAIAGYRRAIEADPELPIAWNGLAMALEKSGDIDGAVEAGQRLIELDPDDVLAHTSLSRFYQQKGMIPEAETEQALAASLQVKQQGS